MSTGFLITNLPETIMDRLHAKMCPRPGSPPWRLQSTTYDRVNFPVNDTSLGVHSSIPTTYDRSVLTTCARDMPSRLRGEDLWANANAARKILGEVS